MKNEKLIIELGVSLKEDNTTVNREKWAYYIIKNNVSLLYLAELLKAERVIAMRFMWLVGHICDLDPKFVYPFVNYFFSIRNEVEVLNYHRSLAKMFYLAGVPEEIEGEAINEMFIWLLHSQVNVSTKGYCLRALEKMSQKHIDLQNELKIVIEDQLNKNTPTFDKLAQKILKKFDAANQ